MAVNSAALNTIQAAIDKYSTPQPWGESKYSTIDQTAANSIVSTLTQLKKKLSDSLNAFSEQETAVPATYQPQYNEHAVQAALALRNVLEGAANRGDMGGMLQQDLLSVNTARQNADIATDTAKAQALQKIRDYITEAESGAGADLTSSIAEIENNRLLSVAN